MLVSLLLASYILSFYLAVKHGMVMYSIDDDPTSRGSATYYWFSEDPNWNSTAGAFYWPILTGPLHCRRVSSFRSYGDLVMWYDKGNDVFLDDVSQIRTGDTP